MTGENTNMTFVDSHLHIKLNGFPLTKLIKYLDREHIDFCWLLSWEEINPGPWEYQHLSVEEIYEAYLKYPSRIIPFYAPDPHRTDAADQLENWHQKGIRGCGELKTTLNWDSEQVKLMLNAAKKLEMPIVFHMEESEYRDIPYSNSLFDRLLHYQITDKNKNTSIPLNIVRILVDKTPILKRRAKSSYFFPGYLLDFASLEVTLQTYTDVNFIAHGLMFWKHISSDACNSTDYLPKGPVFKEGIIWRLLRNYPNLYADISGLSGLNALTRDPRNAREFLSLFADKILYGTDTVMKEQKKFLDSIGLSEGTYKKIYGENAIRLMQKLY